jgi:uncharacterized protein (DUF1778 family)
MTFQRWLSVGVKLSELATSSAWCLGDWLIYGETTYSDRYRQAIEQTSLDYQTLRNYAWVARRFHHERRRPTLSFGHHAEVTALPEPEREYWLRQAEKLSWSRNRLRREVRASMKERESSEEEVESATGRPRTTLNLSVSSEQKEIYRLAATAYGLSLEEWIMQVLEQAAKETVPQMEASPEDNPGLSSAASGQREQASASEGDATHDR